MMEEIFSPFWGIGYNVIIGVYQYAMGDIEVRRIYESLLTW